MPASRKRLSVKLQSKKETTRKVRRRTLRNAQSALLNPRNWTDGSEAQKFAEEIKIRLAMIKNGARVIGETSEVE